jgi:hypothetical protein
LNERSILETLTVLFFAEKVWQSWKQSQINSIKTISTSQKITCRDSFYQNKIWDQKILKLS